MSTWIHSIAKENAETKRETEEQKEATRRIEVDKLEMRINLKLENHLQQLP